MALSTALSVSHAVLLIVLPSLSQELLLSDFTSQTVMYPATITVSCTSTSTDAPSDGPSTPPPSSQT